jgi:hypothetical protein
LTGFKNDELETSKLVFKSCKNMRSIEIYCGGKSLRKKEALKLVVKHSHENISEVILRHYYCTQSEKSLPKELESYIVS